jgi:hypothetical protein
MKRYAYVLEEGESEPPPGILKAFEEAIKVREIIRKNVRSGRTGGENWAGKRFRWPSEKMY